MDLKEKVVEALRRLNGHGYLRDIYKEFLKINTDTLCKSWQSTIRFTLETHCSESKAYKKGNQDLFYMVEGRGRGHWGLKGFNKNQKINTQMSSVNRGYEETNRINTKQTSYNHLECFMHGFKSTEDEIIHADEYQLSCYELETKQMKNTNKIILVLENFENFENIGHVFCLCNAFNIKKVIIVGQKDINFEDIKKTSTGAEKNIVYEIVPNIERALCEIKDLNYVPFCLEYCSDSQSIRKENFSKYHGVALIIGDENLGLSQKTLNLVDKKVHIDVYGNNSSLNVAITLAVAIYKVREDRLFLSEG